MEPASSMPTPNNYGAWDIHRITLMEIFERLLGWSAISYTLSCCYTWCSTLVKDYWWIERLHWPPFPACPSEIFLWVSTTDSRIERSCDFNAYTYVLAWLSITLNLMSVTSTASNTDRYVSRGRLSFIHIFVAYKKNANVREESTPSLPGSCRDYWFFPRMCCFHCVTECGPTSQTWPCHGTQESATPYYNETDTVKYIFCFYG